MSSMISYSHTTALDKELGKSSFFDGTETYFLRLKEIGVNGYNISFPEGLCQNEEWERQYLYSFRYMY